MSLIRKYNVPGPRYTSYPTVPYWDGESMDKKEWEKRCKTTFLATNQTDGISLYIHLPFCEDLCTFCGCHKRITKRHEEEQPYIETVLKEWQLYLNILSDRPVISEIHLGGGTPTFFNVKNLEALITGISKTSTLSPNFQGSFEGHPNHTNHEQLKTLYKLGFHRCSFGVQDYDPIVQKAIHRVQAFEKVKEVTEWAREIGYTSVSHDLVFGLPKQTLEGMVQTIEKTVEIKPDRIAFYSYAHVPWIKGVGQRGFDENDLPKDESKRELYEVGKQMFAENGYTEIGMDHFALENDSLYKSMANNTLHRNFMGYTTAATKLMVGLGMSAISDSWDCFAQNDKSVEGYTALVSQGILPIFRGHPLTSEDLVIRKHILNIMCRFQTKWQDPDTQLPFLDNIQERLSGMIADGLVVIEDQTLSVTPKGIPFVRNVCMVFDQKLPKEESLERRFSKTV